jgi:nonsense-mediated mRNA decay protein 3
MFTYIMEMTATEIPCCICGQIILPNAANQCGACLAQETNLEGILQRGPGGSPEISLHQCRNCRRFERREGLYEFCEPESPELLAICLKHIPALSSSAAPRLHLVDALWVWTEPHSMRLKIRLTVRTEIQNVMIQQRVMVELVIKWKMCPDCSRQFTNRTWHAVVQLRQKRTDDAPKTGLLMIEMALARSPDIRKHVLRIDNCRNGFDFYFLELANAQAFASYLSRIAPMRIKTSKKLVSTDVKNNTANMKHTVTCDMVPLCRDDLIMVHKSARGHNLSGRLCLVSKVSSVVHLVDASPKRSSSMDGGIGEVAPETYYKSGGEKLYRVLSSARRLTRFVVLDIELCGEREGYSSNNNNEERQLYEGPTSGVRKYALADVEVARESDLGQNDDVFRCVTHLGNLLQSGDVALGYDLASSVIAGASEWVMDKCFNSSFVMPDIVLVKKVEGVEKKEEEDRGRAKSSGAKKREKRRKREDKRMRELEKAAERMGFLEKNTFDQEKFDRELVNDPELADEVRQAEEELALVQGSTKATSEDHSEDAEAPEKTPSAQEG